MSSALKTWWRSVIGFVLYFSLLLIPKFIYSLETNSFIFLLGLLLVLIIPLLLLFALWGCIVLVISSIQKRPMGQKSKKVSLISLAGLSVFIVFLFLVPVLPSSPLPTGSYCNAFDRTVWLDPKSSVYVDGDVTPRQKMLADVIKKLPGKTISEIENMLGPSRDSPYFKSTGRNLIYITGPERDSIFGLDSEWLLIWVDEYGVYTRHEIATD